MTEPAPDLDRDAVPETMRFAGAVTPGPRVAAELLSAPATDVPDLGPLLVDLSAPRAAVPLLVDLLDLCHVSTGDAARLVAAIRQTAGDGREIVVLVGDPRLEAVLALVHIPGVRVCTTLHQAEHAIRSTLVRRGL